MQTKFSKVENCVRFDTIVTTKSHTTREMYVDSQMGIITGTASPGQASVPEDAAQTNQMIHGPWGRSLIGPTRSKLVFVICCTNVFQKKIITYIHDIGYSPHTTIF